MPGGEGQHYEQISPKAYEHPADRAATSALRSIPLMDKVIKRLTDVGHERRLRQVLVGNAVRIGEHQVPCDVRVVHAVRPTRSTSTLSRRSTSPRRRSRTP